MREKSASESAFSNVRVLLRLLTLLTGCFLTLTATAQEVWVARYKGPGNARDTAWAVAVDASGNVYVTGASVGSGTGLDYATIKYNSSGIQQWVARYNGSGNSGDEATAIAVDGSGNVYVTGYSTGPASGYDYATIKYNSSGIQQWVARYDGPGNGTDLAFSIAVDGSGNVYVTGFSTGPASGYDYATIKYNSSGIQQWVARYDGPGDTNDYANAIAVDGSGNVYVTGGSGGSRVGCGGACDDYATIKYNSSGIQQWVARYNGSDYGHNDAQAMAIDGLGNVYVTGISWGGGGSGTFDDYATVKYDTSGTQQWVARYNGPGIFGDVGRAIAVDASGNVYVTGESMGSGSGYDYATIKYNSSGTQQWVDRYNGPGNGDDDARAVAIDGSGNVYVTGYSLGSGSGFDYATIKYDSSGTQQWVDRYNGPGNGDDKIVSPGAIAIDASGNAYVTGESTNLKGDYDYATIKYWSCWPACTTGAKKDSFTFARRHAISDRHRAVWPESRIGRIAKKDWKSTDSLKNSRKRLAIN